MFEENPACLGAADKCDETCNCQNKPAALAMEGFSTALPQMMQTVLEGVWKHTEEGEKPVEGRARGTCVSPQYLALQLFVMEMALQTQALCIHQRASLKMTCPHCYEESSELSFEEINACRPAVLKLVSTN